MTEITVEFPVKINGAIITRDAHNALDSLQTGGTLDNNKISYDNGGITNINEYFSDLNNHFIEIIALASLSESNEREKEMLVNLHWIRDRINSFKVPDELLSK